MKGFIVRRAPAGHVVITLRHDADPAKDTTEWLEMRRAEAPDEVAFRRENLLDWTSSEGSPFFPEFASHPKRYVEIRPVDPLQPIIRGWDFGRRKPAVVWMQEQDGQVVVLRSIMPEDIDIHSFRDLVMFLSGQSLRIDQPTTSPELELEALKRRPKAIRFLHSLVTERPWWPDGDPDRQMYAVPFFPPGLRFIDFSGPEAYQEGQFESAEAEKAAAEVLASAGINISWLWKPEAYGDTVIRKLMLAMPDGRPGLVCHPAAWLVIVALAGGLTYATSTKEHPDPDKVRDDGHYINAYDGLRYGIVNMSDVAERVKAYRRTFKQPTVSDRDSRLIERPGAQLQGERLHFYEVDTKPEDWLD